MLHLQTKPDHVDSTCSAYDEMLPLWELADDLRGGTKRMREMGTKWLPQETVEKEGAYRTRLARSFLYGAYGDTVEKLAGKPFSRDVVVEGPELDEKLALIEGEADMSGRNLTQFCGDVFEAAIDHGVTHVLVDMPVLGEGMNLGQERQAKIHPYFTHVRATSLIGWREARAANGEQKLTQVRIHEVRTEDEGQFTERVVHYIRVINAPIQADPKEGVEFQRGTWQLWRWDPSAEAPKDPKASKYQLHKEGTHEFDGIPLVSLYTNRTGFMRGRPAMEDLAWLNVAHWQSSSDQRNILRFARVGILFQSGVTDEEMENALVIGPANMIRTTNPEADMKYVEHTGNSIGAGRQDLVDLKEEMQVLGLQPFMQSGGQKTATEIGAGESRNVTEIQSWIRSMEAMLRQAYELAAQWASTELHEDVLFNIFNEFGITAQATTDAETLLKMRIAGTITHATFLEEVKRRGILSDRVDVEEEVSGIEQEKPEEPVIDDEDEDEDDDDPTSEDDDEDEDDDEEQGNAA